MSSRAPNSRAGSASISQAPPRPGSIRDNLRGLNLGVFPDVEPKDPKYWRSKTATVEKYPENPAIGPSRSSRGPPSLTSPSLYRPLDFDSFEIRLLKLHRGPSSDYVTVSLEYASLINPPEYTALSYCWGDPTKTKKIKVENWGDVEVTINLEQALRNLRHLDEVGDSGHGKGKMLWVDALCINQQDSVERSHQVR
jgi:hypothetical protein